MGYGIFEILQKELQDLSIARRVAAPKANITPSNEVATLSWYLQHPNWTVGHWKIILCIDESVYPQFQSVERFWIWRMPSEHLLLKCIVQIRLWWCTCLGVFFVVWPGTFACCFWYIKRQSLYEHFGRPGSFYPLVLLWNERMLRVDNNAPCHAAACLKKCYEGLDVKQVLWHTVLTLWELYTGHESP